LSYPSRIYLIGMPGAGKTTVGKTIAEELNYSFLDLDELIEKEEGKTISEIFESDGEPAFREKERDHLRAILHEKVVISTGGGAPCFYDGIEWMNQNGLTLYLNRSIQLLVERTEGRSHRPLLKGDLEGKLRQLLEERESCYQKAGMESSSTEPCEIIAELHSFLAAQGD